MATNKVNLGIGLSTGMAYRAPAGTTLPTSPRETLSEDWEEIGAVTDSGITWATGKDSEPIRNWAKVIERLASSDEGGNITAPFMYTNADALKTIFGDDNVVETPANSTHGNLVTVTVEPGVSAEPSAFLFLMKDGDDMLMIGTSNGIIREVSDITLAPTEAVVWETTIESASWTFVKDDGQVS